MIREDSAFTEASRASNSQENDSQSFQYHDSARSIVFRDVIRLRRDLQHTNSAHPASTHGPPSNYRRSVSEAPSFYSEVSDLSCASVIDRLPPLPHRKHDEFLPLTSSDPVTLIPREQHVISLLENQTAVVKTLKNSEWSSFLRKFVKEQSFRTSTSLLPPNGKKMRCFGSTKEYTVGVVFSLPTVGSDDAVYATERVAQQEIERTNTWLWPSGYAAKTEFNVDRHGNLTNGRKEALLSMQSMREYNLSYLRDADHVVGGRIIVGGLSTLPYNEVMIRVGSSVDPEEDDDEDEEEKFQDPTRMKGSYEHGVGYPVALFVRTAQFGHLVALLRARARILSVLGKYEYMFNIPLLLITPEDGVKVITQEMQLELYQALARSVNPFQNTTLHKTDVGNTNADHLRQKIDELIDLNQDDIRSALTREDCARIAGGLGATDESVIRVFVEALQEDIRCKKTNNYQGNKLNPKEEDCFSGLEGFESSEIDDDNAIKNTGHQGSELQHILIEGLASAVRAGDYHTSRQLLIIYSLVATRREWYPENKGDVDEQAASILRKSLTNREINLAVHCGYSSDTSERSSQSSGSRTSAVSTGSYNDCKRKLGPCIMLLDISRDIAAIEKQDRLPCLIPPPIDTYRLRSATNQDGLLIILGAVEILKTMQDGSAKERAIESIEAVDEWVVNGENSVAYRLSAWHSQRTAQADLKIAMEHDPTFTSFIGKHAIENRKKFTALLRYAIPKLESDTIYFLKTLHDMLSQMHSPCLRLELLQYILNLDNRYSVSHLSHSVELAVTCMCISFYENEQLEKQFTVLSLEASNHSCV